MDCPVCNAPMVILELNGVEIDNCLECKGIWLDSGELELLLGKEIEKNELLASFCKGTNSTEKARSCPICKKKMNKVIFGADSDILIDTCKNNHGIWFDSGELESIIRISNFEGGGKVLELLRDMFSKD